MAEENVIFIGYTKIKDSKNLKHDVWPQILFDDPEKMDPNQCILDGFAVYINKIELKFVNGSTAFLHSKNPEGEMELMAFAKKLEEFRGKSYKEILEANF